VSGITPYTPLRIGYEAPPALAWRSPAANASPTIAPTPIAATISPAVAPAIPPSHQVEVAAGAADDAFRERDHRHGR
jgi:hypothetical protein